MTSLAAIADLRDEETGQTKGSHPMSIKKPYALIDNGVTMRYIIPLTESDLGAAVFGELDPVKDDPEADLTITIEWYTDEEAEALPEVDGS